MKIHPYADIFPMMNDAEFASLCEDIKKHGLKDAIMTYRECILDGRNRFKACKAVGETPRFTTYHGDDPLQYVLTKNLHRRHLDESQRALVAANLLKLGKQSTSPLLQAENSPIGLKVTQEDAAKAMNIGVSSVKRAVKIEKQGSEALKEAVQKGEIKLGAAEKIADAPKQTQTKIVEGVIKPKTGNPNVVEVSAATYKHIVKISDKLIREDWIKLGLLAAEKCRKVDEDNQDEIIGCQQSAAREGR